MGLNNKTPAQVSGIKYENHNWADIVGYEKKPIVQTLEPERVKE
jgi:hypothetical protein